MVFELMNFVVYKIDYYGNDYEAKERVRSGTLS